MTTPHLPKVYPAIEKFISEDDLKQTEYLLRDIRSSQSKTASLCQAWAKQREESIATVDRLGKKLDNIHQGCNAAHAAGTAMEIVGGVALVAGAVLTACGHKSIGEILTKKVSPVSTGAGLATTVSSSLAKEGLNYSTMKEVRMVLEKDNEITNELKENLDLAKTINSRLKTIFNCSVLSNIFVDVVQLCLQGIQLLEIGYEASKELIIELKHRAQKGSDISELSETVIQNVYKTMVKISKDVNARKAVKNICHIIHQSPFTVELIKFGLRASIKLCDILSVDVFTPLLGIGALLTTGAGVMATQCLLGSVVVAFNILSLINAIKNAEEGSKYSKNLKDIKLALTCELNTIRESYPNFFKTATRNLY